MKKLFSLLVLIIFSHFAFSQIKISALPLITGSNTDSVWVPIVQGLTTKKARGYMFKGNFVKDTVYAKQPLYVDAGVKDTVKFNADSSGLVKNTFISGGNLYQIVNGDTSLVGSVSGLGDGNFASSNSTNTGDSDIVHNFRKKRATIDSISGFEIKRYVKDSSIVISPINSQGVVFFVGSPMWYIDFSGAVFSELINSQIEEVYVKLTYDNNWHVFKDTVFSGNKYFYIPTPPSGDFGDSLIIPAMRQVIKLPINKSSKTTGDIKALVTEGDTITYRVLTQPTPIVGIKGISVANVNDTNRIDGTLLWRIGGNEDVPMKYDTAGYIGPNLPNVLFNIRTNYNLAGQLLADPSGNSGEGVSVVRLGNNVIGNANGVNIGNNIYSTPINSFTSNTSSISIGNNTSNFGSSGSFSDIGAVPYGLTIGNNIAAPDENSIILGNQVVADAGDEQRLIVVGNNNFLNNLMTFNDGVSTYPSSHILLGNDIVGSSDFLLVSKPTFFLSPNIKQLRFPLNTGTFPIAGALLTMDDEGYANWKPVLKGTANLSGGTVTVSEPGVLSGAKIFVSCNSPGGTQGFLSAPTSSIVAGTSFVINSSSASDNSSVNWWIIN